MSRQQPEPLVWELEQVCPCGGPAAGGSGCLAPGPTGRAKEVSENRLRPDDNLRAAVLGLSLFRVIRRYGLTLASPLSGNAM